MTLIKKSATFKRSTTIKMRRHAATALYALIAISCLGSALCGLITELGKPLEQSANAANELDNIISNGNIEHALGNNKLVEDIAKPIVEEIPTDLNPVAVIISPIPGELGFFQKFISLLTKLLSSVKFSDCEENKQDGELTTIATEPNETTVALDNESSTVVATEILIDSDDVDSAAQTPIEVSEYDSY